MKTIKNLIILLVLMLTVTSCKTQTTMIDKTVVKSFDIDKYLGVWYEIARYDHKFERGLAGVTAEYSYRPDGKIKVLNTGYKGNLNGPISTAEGKAKIPDPKVPAKLKVSFFWIFYADYYILELDEEYEWALIGSKSDNYLWILSREPQMDIDLYEELIGILSRRGYDTSKLIEVEQPMY